MKDEYSTYSRILKLHNLRYPEEIWNNNEKKTIPELSSSLKRSLAFQRLLQLIKNYYNNTNKPLENQIQSTSLTPGTDMELWTDGSLIKNPNATILGCGILLKNTEESHSHDFSFNSETPSSTLAETWALLIGLRFAPENSRIRSFTDSSCLVSNVIGYSPSCTLYQKPEITNIHHLIKKKNLTFSISKVKAHSGIQENEYVDSLARKACAKPQLTLMFDDIPDRKFLHFNHLPFTGKVSKSTRTYLNTTSKHILTPSLQALLQNLPDNVNLRKIIISSILQTDSLNSSLRKFNIHRIQHSLPTRSRRSEWDSNLDPICPHCNQQTEDLSHLFQCPEKKLKLSRLLSQLHIVGKTYYHHFEIPEETFLSALQNGYYDHHWLTVTILEPSFDFKDELLKVCMKYIGEEAHKAFWISFTI